MPSERRRVTVLFADLVGFSTLAEHMDPEDLRGLMSDTFAELTKEVESREGVVEKFIGDAVMAIFGAPVAHEDDPERAADAALRMHELVGKRSAKASSPLSLRIGLDSGVVVAGAVGDGTQTGVMGDAVNTAARLQQAAGPGEVLVGATVWRRIRYAYEGQHVGLLDVKGRTQLVDAYRVVRPRRAGTRRKAAFVGRGDELALLELLWSSAVKGNTHVVSVVGEPGVGKSRLVAELPTRSEGSDIRIACGSERAFGPFLELLERVLGESPRDLEHLKELTGQVGVDEETALLLGAFLGLAGAPPVVRMADEQQKRQVFAGFWQFLLAATGGRPSLVVLDDVHWSDHSSLDLLGFLLERLGSVPIMLVLTYRPGFERVERATVRSSHTGIRLEPLSAAESAELARGILGVTDLPLDLEQIVSSRAEGNPFFIEELLQALIELGSLTVVDGNAVLAKLELEVPDTVQGTILARADRLGSLERSVLQHAAVIGRSFTTELLSAVVDDDIPDALEQLSRSQLLVVEGPRRWAFKHALIQEVLYETLLLRQRKELHRKVAEVLEAQAGDDSAFLELLAEHYRRAEVADKARRYAVAAGDLAAERMGFARAKELYEAALKLWGEGDEPGRLTVLMKLGQSASLGGDPSVARTAFVEAEAGWRDLGNVHQAGAALATLGRVYWVTGESGRAAEALDRAIEQLEPGGPSPDLVRAFVWASTLNMLAGRADVGAELAKRGLELEQDLHLEGARSHLLNTLGCCEAFTGDPGGVERIHEAVALAERSGEAEATGRAYVNLGETLYIFRKLRECVAVCERAREVMRRFGAPAVEWYIAGNEASALAELGRYEDAESLCRETLNEHHSVLGLPGIVNLSGGLSTALVRRGRFSEARSALDEAVPLARRLGGVEFLAYALVQEAELEEARGNRAAARQALTEAADMVLQTPSVIHASVMAVQGARLLDGERRAALLERARAASGSLIFQARLLEAEAWMEGDVDRFRRAADLYESLELGYQESQCRLEAGQLGKAKQIIKRLGLKNGPLGTRLRELSQGETS